MPHFDKHFTLDEANALLPRLQEIFRRVHDLVKEARGGRKPVFENPEKLTAGRTNGKQYKRTSPRPRNREEITKEINDLITEIADQGIVIQDIYKGLVDFPAFVNGEEVFLCYELSDGDRVRFFHAIDAGYAGRQPLPEDMD
ncbi:MAG: DUF2203 domain-containing protein [Candidatus Omnitrophica bacterium]|nr:DUF2203 domain-containing protein [Candidatus Omnitrophota bacterium]